MIPIAHSLKQFNGKDKRKILRIFATLTKKTIEQLLVVM